MAHAEEERKALGRDLAQARKDAGFTMEGAAAELTRRGFPIGKQAIGAWEVGRNLPDTLWLRRLARIYRTSIDALAGGAGASQIPFTQELRAKLLTLSGEELYRVERLIRGHLDMPHIDLSAFTNNIVPTDEQAYSQTHEEQAGVPHEMEVPEPKGNVRSAQDRGRQRKEGRGGS